MPGLQPDVPDSMEPDGQTTGTAYPAAGTAAGPKGSFRVETVTEPPMVRGMGWFFSRCGALASRCATGGLETT